MANKYLDDTGLAHFKDKNDAIYAGSLTLTGNNTLTLKSEADGTLSSVTIGTVTSGATNPGLMTGAQAAKLANVSEGATKVEASNTNGNIKLDGDELTVYTHPSGKSASAGIYKITTNAGGHVTAATAPTAAEWRSALPSASSAGAGLMSSDNFSKLGGIATGAQVNVIEAVKVNNSALTITNKAVNIDLSAYALKTDISQMSTFKGVVASWANLPSSGMVAGDMYVVTAADASHNLPANGNVIYTGDSQHPWDVMGELFTITRIDEATDIDPLFE